MVGVHGSPPYRIAVVHGGPGACGSLARMAEELSRRMNRGVLEPIQAAGTLEELTDELYGQLQTFSPAEQVSLVGHSWGGWLSVLCAAKYPRKVASLVLVGCAPFEDRYVPKILENRLGKLPLGERSCFTRLLEKLSGGASEREIRQVEAFVERTDNVCLLPSERDSSGIFRGDVYASIWEQAADWRTRGLLVGKLEEIVCPVYVIHGQDDPHPLEGVVEPLSRRGVRYQVQLLKNCGHSPFREKDAHADFFLHLASILRR